ncbi:Crp/Fnr family transcriptional regulator [uncultured Sphingomonas sp.]|uniref:Crp/Fnr family transcriptional regulator n=1 Tax=uncultured Sphingomonas sp. TaxID=158754 RepID=UPI002583E5D5|nr:Crp/Fnr family transcriptional regulator [uncultured Sphingomonas sp.]
MPRNTAHIADGRYDLAQEPALVRFAALGLDGAAAATGLSDAVARAYPVRARRELTSEGRAIAEPRLLLRGWAARVRLLPDGRRQFMSFLVPGDLIGMNAQPQPLAAATVIAVTDVVACRPPSIDDAPALADTYAVSAALDEAYLLAQITRLGRLNAQERIADLLLELHERLTLNGMAQGDAFELPLTQEVLADALGLTSVHVNRMVQQARRDGDLQWKGGRVTLTDPVALARKIGRTPPRVSAMQDAAAAVTPTA